MIAALGLLLGKCLADVRIEGDADLIEAALAAQQTNSASYSQGSLSAEVETLTGTDAKIAEVDVLWSPKGCYWRYRVSKTREILELLTPQEAIQSGANWIFYTPKAKLVQKSSSPVFSVPDEARIRPADLWFVLDRSTRPFADLLDPKFAPEQLTRFVVKHDPNGGAVLERHYHDGSYLQFRVDLEGSGNVTGYETVNKRGKPIWYRGRLEWAQNDAGDWFVKELKYEASFTGSPDKIDSMISVKVYDYDATPKIAANRFSIESLDLPEGTRIEEYDANGRPIPGSGKRLPRKISDDDFERLVEQFRQGRLANGGKP